MPITRAYLLAAGRGKRAGGPKAWLSSDGVSLLERQLRYLSEIVPANAISVSIQAGWEERCRALLPGGRFVPVDPDASAFSSFRALLDDRSLRGWSSLHHVDMPVWEKSLFAVPENTDAHALIPVFGDRGGHPVLLNENLGDALMALDPITGRLDHFLAAQKTLRRTTPHAVAIENWNEGP